METVPQSRNIRTANSRIKTILASLSPEDRNKGAEWLGSQQQAKAMFRALAVGKVVGG